MPLESLPANQRVIFHIKYILSLDLQVPEALFQRRNLVHSSEGESPSKTGTKYPKELWGVF